MMEPLVSLEFRHPRPVYRPGDTIEVEYQVDAVEADEILAIEASVLWFTEGKGDEDFAVHFFERRTPTDAENGDLRPMHRFAASLPNSPLSYQGAIVQVRWRARVRVFLRNGKEAVLEKPLQLGSVPAFSPPKTEGGGAAAANQGLQSTADDD